MTEILDIEAIANSDHIFPDNIIDILLSQEESICHDFKLTIDKDNDREWLQITKDFLAFANTVGGYIIFGIKDKAREKIGLREDVFEFLSDANNILLKINRFINPQITNINILPIEINSKLYILIHISKNVSTTHIVEKEGAFKGKYNNKIILLRKGEIYVRRSGQSVIATHSDFEELTKRRFENYKDEIFNNIEKIRYLDSNQEILVRGKDVEGSSKQVYKLSDSSNAIPVKGLPSTTSPESLEETFAVCVGLYKSKYKEVPSDLLMYDFYSNRNDFLINDEQIYFMIKFSLIRKTPCFFWLIKCNKNPTLKIIEELFSLNDYWTNILILKLLWFIDKDQYKYLKKNVKGLGREFSEANKYKGFNLFINPFFLEKQPSAREIIPIFEKDDKELSIKATKIARDLRDKKIYKNEKLWALDCRLYSKYIFNQVEFTNI